MRKLFLVAVATCAIGSLAVPGISSAKEREPTLSVSESCPPELPFDFPYMLETRVSGLAPGEEVTLSIVSPAGTVFEGSFAADEAGVARLTTLSGVRGQYTVSITSPFSATRSVNVDCVPDAPPFPASKEQCKNGGWRNFPGFKNQGDCVSFVATRGRNRPRS